MQLTHSVGHLKLVNATQQLTTATVRSLSSDGLFVTPRTAARRAPLPVGTLQARLLEWVAVPSSRGSSPPRDRTPASCIACGFFTESPAVALNPGTGSLSDTEEERHGHRGEAAWRQRQRRDGGGHQPRDGRLEPPEAGRGGEDPPLERLQGAQPGDPLTSDVWSLGFREDECLWLQASQFGGNLLWLHQGYEFN